MNKNLEYYLGLPYTVEIIPEPEGGYFVGVQELPGCMTEVDSPEEAYPEIREVMRGWLEIALEEGHQIPEPKQEEEYSGKFVVRVAKSLHRKLVDRADEEGVSLNQYVSTSLAEAVGGSPRPAPEFVLASLAVPWPGLSEVAKLALQKAHLSDEAGKADERLFSQWLSNDIQSGIEAFDSENYKNAKTIFTKLTVVLQEYIDRSPIISPIINLVDLHISLVDRILQAQKSVRITLATSEIRAERNSSQVSVESISKSEPFDEIYDATGTWPKR